MTPLIRIQDIAQYDGQDVRIEGWVYQTTGKGRLQFLRVRDGSGIVQCVAFKPELGPELFDAGQGPDPGIIADPDRQRAPG